MEYQTTLSNFNGPLDLLLHLIKVSNINIFDINIEQITKQYLEYIQKMEQLNLNIASEYLVMAAELIEIKSSTLLPKQASNDEDNYEIDRKEELINRLLEYQKYKEITNVLKTCEQERKEYFTKEPSDLNEYKVISPNTFDGLSILDLTNALQRVLEQKELDKPITTKITNKEYSISHRCEEIKQILKIKQKVLFNDLFDVYKTDYIVATFLAILDLTKNNEINLIQDKNFDNIYLSIKE